MRSSRPSEESVKRAETLACTGGQREREAEAEAHLAPPDQQAYRERGKQGLSLKATGCLDRGEKSRED